MTSTQILDQMRHRLANLPGIAGTVTVNRGALGQLLSDFEQLKSEAEHWRLTSKSDAEAVDAQACRIRDLVSENVTLRRENEANAFAISPAMYEAKIAEHVRTIEQLKATNAADLARLEEAVALGARMADTLDCVLPALEAASGLKASEFTSLARDDGKGLSPAELAALWLARSILERPPGWLATSESVQFTGTMTKAGNDEAGEPVVIIHADRDSLAAMPTLPLYRQATFTVTPHAGGKH